MAGIHCFTSASFAYLDRVRVLGETLRRHHPDWILWLCLSDQEPIGFHYDPAEEYFDNVVRLSELGIADLCRWTFDHDVVELCTAVKGPMLCRLLEGGAEKVIYLDPDIAVVNGLWPVIDLLDHHDVVLTPHQVEPDDDEVAIWDNEIGSLKYGIYNLGFLAVAGTDEGWRFARWWRDRLLVFCFDDLPKGLFTDQRWCDHVPGFFDNVHILRDPGYNVASWNLSRRPITIEPNGDILAARHTLRFFHFTKVTWIGEIMLERYAADRMEVFELLRWYRARLAAHVVQGLPASWWAYGSFADGTPVTRQHRIAYRGNPELRERYPDPFVAGPAIFETATR
jgi:hypothetical protein